MRSIALLHCRRMVPALLPGWRIKVMRKFISFALLASVAIPVAAWAQDGGRGEGRRARMENRSGDAAPAERVRQRPAEWQASAPRPERQQRAAPAVEANVQAQATAQAQTGSGRSRGDWGNGGRGNWRGNQQQAAPAAPAVQQQAPAVQPRSDRFRRSTRLEPVQRRPARLEPRQQQWRQRDP